jgi:zinc transport system ATP-binding protein
VPAVSAPIIEVEGLAVAVGGRSVLADISFGVGNGEVLAVVGPNGAGKTTLLGAVLGTIPLASGRVRLFGRERLTRREAEEWVAYLPQRMHLDRSFPITLGEMLRLSPRVPLESKYIEMLRLGGLMHRRVGELSGGEMQRALLAYAIMKEPRLLVMDEPTSWVDAEGADCVICIMEEFRQRGISMVVVSHDFSVISSVATHVLGIGHEGHFFRPAGARDIEERLLGLFGTSHHEGGRACRAITLGQRGGEAPRA